MFSFIKRDYYIIFFTIIFIFCLDRFTKEYVIYLSNQNLNGEIYISEYLNIFLIWNDGIAFGLFSDNNQILYNIISGIILLIITVLFYLMIKAKRFKKFIYIIIIGGALGNFFDRIVNKSVPDFIDLHYQGFHWFIFNVADIFITIGVICLIYDEVFLEKKRNDRNA